MFPVQVSLLRSLLQLPAEAVTERDVLQLLGAESGDLVRCLAAVLSVYTDTLAADRETLVQLMVAFTNQCLGKLYRVSVPMVTSLSPDRCDASPRVLSLAAGRSRQLTAPQLSALVTLASRTGAALGTLSRLLTPRNTHLVMEHADTMHLLTAALADYLR